MTARDLQSLVGPEKWPEVDELLNDIRRECAEQLQLQAHAHAAELEAKDNAHQKDIGTLTATLNSELDAKDAECAAAVAANDALEGELTAFKTIIDTEVLPAAQALVSKLAQGGDVAAFLAGIAPVMAAASKGPTQRALEAARAAKEEAEARIAELQRNITVSVG